MQRIILIAVVLLLIGATADSANKQGLQAEGTLIPGNLVVVGTTANDLKDGGPMPNARTLAIGDVVGGAQILKCLTVDAQGKLAQLDCLIAH